ncbi:MAG: hypothetical protein D8M58_19840 [Calditrichaeota bacterium]|nr:MAG: hypothetical protein DWQ03_14585 [Calditrichota bacterium]MBL1207662.1 hypothetical protein [Calditrichota bacterium]NOG47495.1 hypothetical protein [Calditrichota bacterium]
MSGLELRPRFKIETDLSPENVIQKICTSIDGKDAPCEGSVVTNHAVLRMPENEIHFWSPQLNLDVSKKDDGSEIRGLFGPSPGVWTLFMFLYMGFAVIGIFGLFYGLSQMTLDKEPVALWSVPIIIALELSLYFIAQTGKKLGQKQMHELNSILNRVLKNTNSLSTREEK